MEMRGQFLKVMFLSSTKCRRVQYISNNEINCCAKSIFSDERTCTLHADVLTRLCRPCFKVIPKYNTRAHSSSARGQAWQLQLSPSLRVWSVYDFVVHTPSPVNKTLRKFIRLNVNYLVRQMYVGCSRFLWDLFQFYSFFFVGWD
jgi:hypothetical protein